MYSVRGYIDAIIFFFLNVFEFSETNTKKEKESYVILLI